MEKTEGKTGKSRKKDRKKQKVRPEKTESKIGKKQKVRPEREGRPGKIERAERWQK